MGNCIKLSTCKHTSSEPLISLLIKHSVKTLFVLLLKMFFSFKAGWQCTTYKKISFCLQVLAEIVENIRTPTNATENVTLSLLSFTCFTNLLPKILYERATKPYFFCSFNILYV